MRLLAISHSGHFREIEDDLPVFLGAGKTKRKQEQLTKRRFWLACLFLLIALMIGSNCQLVRAKRSLYISQATASLSDDINKLEAGLGLNPAQEGSTEQRLAVLEYHIIGKIQLGSLVSRVERLKKIGSAKQNELEKSRKEKSEAGVGFQLKASEPVVGKVIGLLPLPNNMNASFVRMAPAGSKPDLAGDYFLYVMRATKGKVVRFKQMPIPVYISPSPEPSFASACVHSFEMWEERSHGIVRFVQVDLQAKARIRVIWGHLGVSNAPGDCTMGAHTVTRWQPPSAKSRSGIGIPMPRIGSGNKYVVPPQVIEVNLDLIYSKPADIRSRLLKNVIAHELGHALGILSHSPVRSDLMYGVTDECSRLSQRDLNTLNKIYEAKLDVPL